MATAKKRAPRAPTAAQVLPGPGVPPSGPAGRRVAPPTSPERNRAFGQGRSYANWIVAQAPDDLQKVAARRGVPPATPRIANRRKPKPAK